MTLVSENQTTFETTTMSAQAQGGQESHRKLQCQGCVELKKARKELKRVKQELRAARQLAYSEQQRAQRLHDLLDLTASEVRDLRHRMGHLDTLTPPPVEGWLDVCTDFKRRTRRRPNKSRGITWQRRYLVARGGRLYVCRGPGVWDAQQTQPDTATAVIDINDTVKISAPGPDDPEVFLLNRNHQKVIKITYDQTNPHESSSASDSSESATSEASSGRVLMLEAASVEEKQRWLTAFAEQRATSATTDVDHRRRPLHLAGYLNSQNAGEFTGSLTDADLTSNFRFRQLYMMRRVKTRHDSEGSQLSSAASSQMDIDDIDDCETPKCSQSDNDADDMSENGSDVTEHSIEVMTKERETSRVGSNGNIGDECLRRSVETSPEAGPVDDVQLALLVMSVLVATAALVLMCQSL